MAYIYLSRLGAIYVCVCVSNALDYSDYLVRYESALFNYYTLYL